MDTNDAPASDTSRVIKKYQNRRLYDLEDSRYITLQEIAELIRQGIDVKVQDAQSGNNITRAILTQIIVDQETYDSGVIPTDFLRALVTMGGNDGMRDLAPSLFSAALDMFRHYQSGMQNMLAQNMTSPLSQLQEQQRKYWEGVQQFQQSYGGMISPFAQNSGGVPSAPPAPPQQTSPQPPSSPEPPLNDELRALRARLDALEADQKSKS